jgi:hypothetical protein
MSTPMIDSVINIRATQAPPLPDEVAGSAVGKSTHLEPCNAHGDATGRYSSFLPTYSASHAQKRGLISP